MNKKTAYNYEPTKGQTFKMPSQTVPDQTLTVRELLVRHSRGLNLDGYSEPIYDEEGTSQGIRFESLDLVDRQAMMNHAKDVQQRAKRKVTPTPGGKENETLPEGH